MTYIVDVATYELYAGDEKVFYDLMMNARVLHFKYDKGWLLFKSIFIYLC